jgi:hypothetical protein
MFVLGVILLILGLLFQIGLLTTIGVILLIVGAELYLLGAAGRPIGPAPAIGAAARAALSMIDRDERAAEFHTVQERLREEIFWAPLAWTNGSNYTVNTSRWANLDDGSGQTNNVPWAAMQWVGN